MSRAALMAAGAALLCAACQRSVGVKYGLPGGGATVDADEQTDAGGATDGAADSSDEAK